MPIGPTAIRYILAAGIGVAAMQAAPALAQDADAICTAEPGTPLPAGADAQTLASMARQAENAMLGEAATTSDLAAPDTGSAATSQERAAAQYCAAMGERLRLDPDASRKQTRSYLIGAFRRAWEGGESDVAALSAFRLGLAAQGAGSAGSGTRGGTRGRRGATRSGSFAVEEGIFPAQLESDACARLFTSRDILEDERRMTNLSLVCASEAGINDRPLVASLANLRLTRMFLADADIPGAEDYSLRTADEIARGGLAIAARISAPSDRARVIGRLVESALDAERAEPASLVPWIDRMQSAAVGNAELTAAALGLRGRVAMSLGQRAQAAGLARQAIMIESQRPFADRLPDWLLLLAEAEPEQSSRHVFEAYQALEAVRPFLPDRDPLTDESVFTLRMRDIFQAAVASELEQPGDNAVRIARAQQIIEAYRQAEIQSVFGSECIPPADPVDPGKLRAGEIVLYPIVLPDRLELIYAQGGPESDGRFHRLPAQSLAQDDVGMLVREMTDSIVYFADDAWEARSRRLYDLLIAPIADRLTPQSTLIIVPDGPLRSLPFAALRDAEGQFLAERTRLSVAPALSYSEVGSRTPKRPAIVAAALSTEVSVPAGDFAALENTITEAQTALDYGDIKLRHARLLANFSKDDLENALSEGPLDILHLATHASFNGRSDRSFIVADGEVIMLSELRAMIEERKSLGDRLNLLVLSACETAVGDDQASMGLAGAAVQAGAPSVLASLWQVDDEGTSLLMEVFYDNLAAGMSKSEALREAQLAMIRSGESQADPYVWSSFVLLGGWR